MFSVFLDNNIQHMLLCAKMISSWVRKVVCIFKVNMSPGAVKSAVTLAPGVSWYPSYRQVTGPEIIYQLDIIFPHISLLLIDTRIMYSILSWALVSE